MGRYVLVWIFLLLLNSCSGLGKEEQRSCQQQPRQQSFDQITFSIGPHGAAPRHKSKDVDISQDGTAYYRLRNDRTILGNYQVHLDAAAMARVDSLVGSVNIDTLPAVFGDLMHGNSYSFILRASGSEKKITGMDLPQAFERALLEIVEIVESQSHKNSPNRHFATAREVLLPAPPGMMEPQEVPDSL